jgi:peroxiredoxin
MTRSPALVTLALAAAVALPAPAGAQAVVGSPAPVFSLSDSNGQTRALADYRGRFVVLEWWNYECPFVEKHYGSGNMQRLQKAWTDRGVAWLTINSSAPGKQGHVDGAKANALMKQKDGSPTAVLLDPAGRVGRLYAAKTTPHMFVVDPKGTLVYAGGIDDKPSTSRADVAPATNYVADALAEATAGRPVTTPSSQPYGCSVKYAE